MCEGVLRARPRDGGPPTPEEGLQGHARVAFYPIPGPIRYILGGRLTHKKERENSRLAGNMHSKSGEAIDQALLLFSANGGRAYQDPGGCVSDGRLGDV